MEALGEDYQHAVPFKHMFMGENRTLEEIEAEENAWFMLFIQNSFLSEFGDCFDPFRHSMFGQFSG